jgi:hypothetical protein
LERKRRTLWSNLGRNKIIAAVAQALTRGRLKELCRLGVPLWVRNRIRQYPDRKIAVLVESTEHAQELAALLPGWMVRSAVPGKGVAACETKVSRRGAARTGAILTQTYAGLHGLEADILIRATGGCGKLPLDDFAPEEGARSVSLLVDLDDVWDEQAKQDTMLRRRFYWDEGWRMIETEPIAADT